MPDVGQHSLHDEAPADAPTPPDKPPVGDTPTGPDALNEALRHAAETREYFIHWLAAEADRLKLRVRRAAMWMILGVAALAIVVAIVMTAAGLLLVGLAELIANLLGQRAWLGAVITGGGILLLAAAGIAIGMWSWQKSAFEKVRQRYAVRLRSQEAKVGRSLEAADGDVPDT